MNFLFFSLAIFFPFQSSLANNSEKFVVDSKSIINNKNIKFNDLPLDLQKKILYESDTFKNTPQVCKNWNQLITSDKNYEAEKQLNLRLVEIKNHFDNNNFNKTFESLSFLVVEIRSFIEEPPTRENISNDYNLVHTYDEKILEKKQAFINKKIKPKLNEFFTKIIDNFLYSSSFDDMETFQILSLILTIDLLHEDIISKIFNWSLDKCSAENPFYLRCVLIEKILSHPHCSTDHILKSYHLTLDPEITSLIKRSIYQGLAFQKMTDGSILDHVYKDKNFWPNESTNDSIASQVDYLKIFSDLFTHPSFIPTNNLKIELWNKILTKIEKLFPIHFNSQGSEVIDSNKFLKIFKMLFFSQISTSQAYELIDYVKKMPYIQQIELLKVILINNFLDEGHFKNDIFQIIKNLILNSKFVKNEFFLEETLNKTLETISLIHDETFLMILTKAIIIKMNSFDSQNLFFNSISKFLKNKNSLSFKSYMFNELLPVFLFRSQDQKNSFLTSIYQNFTSLPDFEIEKFLKIPIEKYYYRRSKYYDALDELLRRIPHDFPAENKQNLFNQFLTHSTQYPKNIQKFIFLDLCSSFFMSVSDSFLINQALDIIKSWGDNSSLRPFALYVFSNLKYINKGSYPLLDKMISNLKDEKIKSIIENRLTQKKNIEEVNGTNEIFSLISQDDIEIIKKFNNY